MLSLRRHHLLALEETKHCSKPTLIFNDVDLADALGSPFLRSAQYPKPNRLWSLRPTALAPRLDDQKTIKLMPARIGGENRAFGHIFFKLFELLLRQLVILFIVHRPIGGRNGEVALGKLRLGVLGRTRASAQREAMLLANHFIFKLHMRPVMRLRAKRTYNTKAASRSKPAATLSFVWRENKAATGPL
jgi:hypothetical protein